ncbi:hypothetical protein [Vandammella animalimorsus]|uniref:hypothetical protein n=1 Tax=Vandammella animalimorsus TaxID=2029117 RepID=UPI001177E577|nr:hypothetical protein [Vandammella animalimorsus]
MTRSLLNLTGWAGDGVNTQDFVTGITGITGVRLVSGVSDTGVISDADAAVISAGLEQHFALR